MIHGEEQLPCHPGLTRGLVAVLLYYEGRKCVVTALRSLMAGRSGHTWATDTHPEVAQLITDTTASLMEGSLVSDILRLLNTMDWTKDLAGLQKAAASGEKEFL